MSVFALVHGAWHGAWCWDLLRPELERRGHSVVAMDLPWDDPAAGHDAAAGAVVAALDGAGDDIVLVGHFLGGVLLPVVADRRPVRRIVFVCPLVPRPGRRLDEVLDLEPGTFRQGWPARPRVVHDDGSVSWEPDAAIDAFYHDCDPAVASWAAARLRRQAWGVSQEPSPFGTWPAADYAVVYCSDDRVVAPGWAEDVARDVVEVEPVRLPGGHAPMLARPAALAAVLARGEP